MASPAIDSPMTFWQKARLRAGLRWQYLRNCLFHAKREIDLTLGESRLRLSITTRRELKRAGDFHMEAHLVNRITHLLEPDDTVFDVGANIGMISLLLATHPRGQTCRYVAFEPEPRNVAQLERNIALNGLSDRMRACRQALSAQPGKAALFVRGTAGEGRHSLVAAEGSSGEVEVELTTGAAYCRETNTWPNLMKIDVEGAEGEVLAGFDTVFAEKPPRDLIMEIHDKGGRDAMPDGTPIEAFLKGHGYRCVWDHPRGSGRHLHFQHRSAEPGRYQ
ncbi:MAG: FkbM family methyltransferase [Opitutales bacterium]